MKGLKHLLELTEENACVTLKRITEAEAEEWDIHFIEEQGTIRLDEGRPIVCQGLNLSLYNKEEITLPERFFPDCEILGICGDDEFAWVCRRKDGSIEEIDEYDLRKGVRESDLSFPSLSHYLLFVAGD